MLIVGSAQVTDFATGQVFPVPIGASALEFAEKLPAADGKFAVFGTHRYTALKRSGSSWYGVAWPTLGENPAGSSDALFLAADGLLLSGFKLTADDRAAVKTGLSRPTDSVTLDALILDGNFSTTDEKWLIHTYATSNWTLRGCILQNTATSRYGEHGWYEHLHGMTGAHLVLNSFFARLGRTALQFVCRRTEGPQAVAGLIGVKGVRIRDVCLESGGGGSALSFRGATGQDLVVQDTSVRLGCDPNLPAAYQPNITGALVIDLPADSWGPAKSAKLKGLFAEVGLYYPGSGNAPRPCHMVGDVPYVEVEGCTTLLHNNACRGIAWDLNLATIGKLVVKAGNTVQGGKLRVVNDGRTFASWADLAAAGYANVTTG
jgi:hypothetical protein